jgi:uncharacterized protein
MDLRSFPAGRVIPASAAVAAITGVALLFAATRAIAQEPMPRPDARGIRVTGTGEEPVPPDLPHLDLAVETFAPTAREAGEENARVMERVIQALVRAGIPRAEIETRGYSLFPEYPPQPREPVATPQPRGYRALNMVTFRTQELARVGPLIDIALGAGANRLDGVRFGLQDPEAAQSQALALAVERARRSAETMAGSLGVRLGRIVDASTVADMVRPVPFDMARVAMEDAPETPIQPGEQTVNCIAARDPSVGCSPHGKAGAVVWR